MKTIQFRKKILGSRLRHLREEAKLTQKEVADALNFSTPQFVSNWERGVSYPSLDSIPKLAKLFRMQRLHLIGLIFECKAEELDIERSRCEKKYA